MDLFSLQGKIAVVSGGGGKYGKQIVKALCEAGADVWVTTSRADHVDGLADEFAQAGYTVQTVYMDLGDEASILAARDTIAARHQRVDVLINNAVARIMKRGWAEETAKFDASMRINATGLFVVTRAFGDVMAANNGGSIVNIASMYGMVGPDLSLYEGLGTIVNPDYFFHKAGMINMTAYISSHYGASGVRCNSISPGGFWTAETSPTFVERYNKRTHLGRMANETDLMGAILFLASDASAYVTGANIPVDGGYTAK